MRARVSIVWVMLAAWASPVAAHDGPPYAIVVDRVTGPYRLSIWGDPDVGTGTFWIYLEPLTRGATAPDGVVRVFTRPKGDPRPETRYDGDPQRAPKGSRRFRSKVQFDHEGPWSLRVEVASAAGGGETETDVNVTPPGQGPVLDFVLYLFPFAGVAFLFVKAALKRGSTPKPTRTRS